MGLVEGIALVLMGVLAGVVESTAGGSGLLTLPTLILFGIEPVQAIATSKFQYGFGAITAIVRFSRSSLISWKESSTPVVVAFLAGLAGAFTLMNVDSAVVQRAVPFFLLLAGGYFALSPSFSDIPQRARVTLSFFTFVVVPLIGFYDGFIGTGSASFLTAAFVLLRGLGVTNAVASTKLVDFASGMAALGVLLVGGKVLYQPGLLLAAGQMAGGWLGASLVIKYGSRWVKPIISLVTIILSVKLFIN